jgi:hypothetical protein
MPEYMLILHEEQNDFAELSAEAIQQVIEEYMAWSNAVAETGKMTGGQKLRDDGGRNLVLDGNGLRVTDGPFAEAKEVIGGFFTILADDYEDAVKIASTCPHLKYGGRIELREIEPTS